jgi:hypothetical protein
MHGGFFDATEKVSDSEKIGKWGELWQLEMEKLMTGEGRKERARPSYTT